jgi:hypothetical protein
MINLFYFIYLSYYLYAYLGLNIYYDPTEGKMKSRNATHRNTLCFYCPYFIPIDYNEYLSLIIYNIVLFIIEKFNKFDSKIT